MEKRPERFLFTTYHPEYWRPGRIFTGYRITRVVAVAPYPLTSGGRQAVYEVYGRPWVPALLRRRNGT